MSDLMTLAEPMVAIAAGRTVSDAEILDHVAHCTHLQELAMERFVATGDPVHREAASEWTRCIAAAWQCLSPQWKAAREAEIMRSMDEGVGFFVAQGEQDRAAMLARRTA